MTKNLRIFLNLQVVREITRVNSLNQGELLLVPDINQISSYVSYQRLKNRGGVRVGEVSVQDILDYGEMNKMKNNSPPHECLVINLVADAGRDFPFFAMALSTRNLMDQLDSSRPIQSDETFKVIHEGYALTLIGQSDMDRKFHLR